MAFLGILGDLGSKGDTPDLLAEMALAKVKDAVCMSEREDPQRVHLRMAAELAALALDSALEVIYERDHAGDRARIEALSRISKVAGKKFSKKIADVRRILHSQCYHKDAFKGGAKGEVSAAVGQAVEIVDRILSLKGRGS